MDSRHQGTHMLRIVGPAALLLLSGLPGVTAYAQSDPAAEWIRANAIPLRSTEAGHGFADMQPLKPLIGNARIVALGEATHGTREFFQLKHRMLEFLATEMGFTIFSIEANMPEAYRLNDYVLNGTGDPGELLRGMYFWTWNTEEVLEMIRWMRAFNASGRGRVQFTGFDMQTHTVALDIVQRFVRRYDSAYVAALGEASRRIPARDVAAAPGFGVATGTFPLTRAAGRTIRFSGYVRTEGVTTGYAGLWWRVDGAPGTAPLAFDNMSTRGATGTADWRPFAIELSVPSSARNINFGMLMPGSGTAWFDDLSVELDGQPFADSSTFDFGFESASPRGFFTGGSGYRVTLDNTVAHTGRQSLRMTRVAAVDTAPPIDRTAVVAQWSDVLTHLEQRRGSYRALGATNGDIDWAIQNARVVLQAVQTRLGLVSRDRSMALNVKWILDQNPGQKIVLWAHNGHVARGGMISRSMGAELHDIYGAQMVVLGFAFNRGSFQAIGARGGGLQNFTVGPAPGGSFDALLGGAGIPLFALDLRNAPAWLREERLSRQIGAVFATETASSYVTRLSAPAIFDGILFVENTTAARPNVRR
jgi:erythromycin esterase-like protein